MYITSYKTFTNKNTAAENKHIKAMYNSQRQELKNQYLIILKTFKAKNSALASKFKDIHSQFFMCLNSDELRQNLIEEHCSHSSITLARHNLYHENSDTLKEQILTYFSKYKTFLNELAVFLSRTDLLGMRGIRSKSFGSLLESIKDNSSTHKTIKLLKIHKQFIENILYFRDKFIEHPKSTFDFYLESQPFKGSILVPAVVNDHDDTPEEIFIKELIEINEDLSNKLELSTAGIEMKDQFIYYYHVKNVNQSYIQNTGIEIYEEHLPSYISFDNTKTHFIKYGIHYHCFPDPELIELANQIFVDNNKQKNNIKMINYKSPSYFECQKHLYSFLTALLV